MTFDLRFPASRIAVFTLIGEMGLLAAPKVAGAQHIHPVGSSIVDSASCGTVGSVNFPNSGATRAQPDFLRGVALLHSFSYDAARDAFRRAQKKDPSFALAYWGEALSDRGPQGWMEDTTAARAALARLGTTPALRAARAPTPRERAYLAAAETLFGANEIAGDQRYSGVTSDGRLRIDSVRIARYAEAMKALHETYPNDDEAAVFYAHALMNRRNFEYGDPQLFLRTSVEMAAAIEDLFARHPRHPGAAHFLIHAYDDSRLAPLGLRAAQVYEGIAPCEEHAQHMPSHIFVRYGQWDDMVRSSERAWALTRAAAGKGADAAAHYEWHNAHFLQYAYLQVGRWREAKALADSASALLASSRIAHLKTDERPLVESFLYRIIAQYEDETQHFAPISLNAQSTAPVTLFTRKDARGLDSLASLWRAIPADSLTQEVRLRKLSEIQYFKSALSGEPDSAISLLDKRCKTSIANPNIAMMEGPRAVGHISCELEGELLADNGRYTEALTAYDLALGFAPGHWIAQLGRARALYCTGATERARAAYANLLKQWSHADADLPALAEVNAQARDQTGRTALVCVRH